MGPHQIHTGHPAWPQCVKKKKQNYMKLEKVEGIGKELRGRERGLDLIKTHDICVYEILKNTNNKTKQNNMNSNNKGPRSLEQQWLHHEGSCWKGEFSTSTLEPWSPHRCTPGITPSVQGLKPNATVALRVRGSIWSGTSKVLGNEHGLCEDSEKLSKWIEANAVS